MNNAEGVLALGLADLDLLLRLQKDSFAYFLHEVNPANGLVKDKTADDAMASITAVGMALTAYPIGVERGWMPRQQARALTLAALRFFADSEQGVGPDASGYRGFYYHFLDMHSGRRAGGCELSSIDTALLMAGALTAAAYFDGEDDDERCIGALAGQLYRRVDWQWMRAASPLLCHGWQPPSHARPGFLPSHWQGYDESLILQVLALGSPTHPIDAADYGAWTASFAWKQAYGIDYLYAGPLFIHQMSQLWLDLRGVRDTAMAAHGSDYFDNSRRATLVQQAYAIANPQRFAGYGANCWGITASDGPGDSVQTVGGRQRRFFGYLARGAPFGPDDGTLAPWAAAASLPFAPDIVMAAIKRFEQLHLRTANPYGFKASFSATWQRPGAAAQQQQQQQQQQEQQQRQQQQQHQRQALPTPGEDAARPGWVSPHHFGINVGPTVIMIDNYLHGLVWRLLRSNDAVRRGLQRARFSGGWLDRDPPRTQV